MLVKKASGKWIMCVNYTDFSYVFPKDSYQHSNIDKLGDNLAKYKLWSFMDAYISYYQIPMYDPNIEKTTFITERANY